ncbi:GFY1 [Auxenochlorella protothecoides x Auxenochlorella symbiontica]|uniref:Uncharacterized protein n=1 Tax=Auxenochlorella protothecoides TaxID=3075 RepID=A0A087SD67_AUXPR|nr:Uncharacterized protein F751_3887 [Auxenochlorella protothecoides]KFM23671.1 Uncharacterized protein F751_3887 [Auxenochlorella protothecoides]RMZ55168.1 hypothetical protein APUTEX25_005446 [Auxenochlorella protothecoides]|eukprot:RMZ55168.1 hypothetical protein APUTEX25_005446 [Auxenochlorella protothecoides]
MADASTARLERTIVALEARLATLTDDGVKTIPATSNPGPLGLFAFGLTTALLQGINSTVVDKGSVGLVYSFGFFFGGLCQLIAGVLEYSRKNTFATVAFVSYGGFWMAVALNGTLVAAGVYPTSVKGEEMMLSLWGIYTFLLWLCTFSSNLALSSLFLSLALLFFFLAGGQTNHNLMKFAGVWGFIVSAIAWYLAVATLMEELYGRVILPIVPFAPINKIKAGTFGTRRRVDDPELGSKE